MTSDWYRNRPVAMNVLCIVLVASVTSGCITERARCSLHTVTDSYAKQVEPTFKNLTPEAVDRYPVLVELVAADEPFTKVNLGCDQQEEIWAYLGDQGYVSEHESLETAWVAWEGEKEGIGRNRQVN